MSASSAQRMLAVAMLIAVGVLALRVIRDDRTGGEHRPELEASAVERPVVEAPNAALAPVEAAAEFRTDRSPVTPNAVAVAITDPRGEAVADARWVAFRGAEVLASGITSADGIARVGLGSSSEAMDAGFELAANHAGFPPARWTLACEPPRQAVELGRGAVVSGVVRIDGAPPAEPLRLSLHANPAFWQADELPGAAASALLGGPRRLGSIRAETQADGAFRFEGLAPTWNGRISWPQEYRSEPAPRADLMGALAALAPRVQLWLEAPREGLVLELRTAPTIVGRVVRPDGEPVAEGQVEAEWISAGGSGSLGGRAEVDGTFHLRFDEALPAHLEIEVAEKDGAGFAAYALNVPAALKHWDAGDLAVRSTRLVSIVVRNERGAPVRDASLIEAGGARTQQSNVRTDADGSASAKVDRGPAALRVEAAGYDHAVVAVDAGVDHVDVVLVRGTVLVVELSSADPALRVAVLAREEPFLGKDRKPSRVPAILAEGISSSAGGGAAVFHGSGDGRYELAGVRPGVPMRVVVADAFARALAERDVLPLERGEERVVRIEVQPSDLPPPSYHTLRGRVVNAAGLPLPGAMVQVGPLDGRSMNGVGADAHGRFVHDRLTAERVRVVVSAPGHAPLTIAEQPLTDAEVELVLGEGRDVRIRVIDAHGAPAEGAQVNAPAFHWFTGGAEEISPGVYGVAHMPLEVFEATVLLAGREFSARFETGIDEVQVEVPARQPCRIVFAGEVELLERGSAFAVLRGVGDTPPSFVETQIPPGASQVVETVFPGVYEVFVVRQEQSHERLSDPVEIEIHAEKPASVAVVLREP